MRVNRVSIWLGLGHGAPKSTRGDRHSARCDDTAQSHEKFDKFERIGSTNLNLNLAGNVPDLNVFSEMPVVGL